jgi:hypothetical protein
MEHALEILNKHPWYSEVSTKDRERLEAYLRVFSQCFATPYRASATPDFDNRGKFLIRVSYYAREADDPQYAADGITEYWPWRGAGVFYPSQQWLPHANAAKIWDGCVEEGNIINMTNGELFWG